MTPVGLSDLELRVIRAAMREWGGSARPTDEFAAAMGFSDSAHMPREAEGLWQRVDEGDLLSADDWRRVLLAVEVVFASNVVGAGLDWETTSGISDAETIVALRSIQRSLTTTASAS